MTQLPLLGGNNGTVGTINNLGQVAGVAETGVPDASCASTALQYEAVIWGPNKDEIHALPPLHFGEPGGDTVGVALAINDHGQAVGASGLCSNSGLPPLAFGTHAVLWESDGSVHDLGNLGAAAQNVGLAINNLGQVVGASTLRADSTPSDGTDAFLWTKEKGIRNLGTLPGDGASGAVGINDAGDVVGLSAGSGGIRAVLWQNEVIADLNTLIPAGSPLFLLFATGINFCGEIAGFGVQKRTGDVHAFLATPIHGRAGCVSAAPAEQGATSESGHAALSEEARRQLQQRLHFGRFGTLLMGPQ